MLNFPKNLLIINDTTIWSSICYKCMWHSVFECWIVNVQFMLWLCFRVQFIQISISPLKHRYLMLNGKWFEKKEQTKMSCVFEFIGKIIKQSFYIKLNDGNGLQPCKIRFIFQKKKILFWKLWKALKLF